jgi:hypothetical protein
MASVSMDVPVEDISSPGNLHEALRADFFHSVSIFKVHHVTAWLDDIYGWTVLHYMNGHILFTCRYNNGH